MEMQQKHHTVKISYAEYVLIKRKSKKVILKLNRKSMQKIKRGDTISFDDYSSKKFLVTRINAYEDFAEAVDYEDPKLIDPREGKYELLSDYHKRYAASTERKWGACAIQIEPCAQEENKKEQVHVKTLRVSYYFEEKRKGVFVNLLYKAYNGLIYEVKDPDFCREYWGKIVPAVIDGTMEIIMVMLNNRLAGVSVGSRTQTDYIWIPKKWKKYSEKILQVETKLYQEGKPSKFRKAIL